MIGILGRDKLGILFHLWQSIFHHDGVINEIQHRNVVVAVAKRISWDAGEIGVGNQLLDAFFLGTAFVNNIHAKRGISEECQGVGEPVNVSFVRPLGVNQHHDHFLILNEIIYAQVWHPGVNEVIIAADDVIDKINLGTWLFITVVASWLDLANATKSLTTDFSRTAL